MILHRGCGRINVGVPHHELFEDVVLDRAGELLRRARPAPRRRRCRARAPAARRRSSSSTRSSCRAGCRRTGCACRGSSRWRRPPCRRRRRRAGDRCRSRDGSRDRTRSTGPSGPRRGCAGRTRSSPRPSRSRRTGGPSTASARTSSGRARARTAGCRAAVPSARRRRDPRRCRARRCGMPSGVSQLSRAGRRGARAWRAVGTASKSSDGEIGQTRHAAPSSATRQDLGQHGDHVAADEDEPIDAGLAQRAFERARVAPRGARAHARGLERARPRGGFGGVALVAAAEAGDAARLVRCRLARASSAGGEEARGEARRGRDDSASGPSVTSSASGAGGACIDARAQRLERLGIAMRGERPACGGRPRVVRPAGSFSSRFANSDTPSIGSLRFAIAVERAAFHAASSRAASSPLSSAARCRLRARSRGSAPTPRARARP